VEGDVVASDGPAMRRLVDEVVTDYDERTLTSPLLPLPDPRSAARTVYDAVAASDPCNAISTILRSKKYGSTSD